MASASEHGSNTTTYEEKIDESSYKRVPPRSLYHDLPTPQHTRLFVLLCGVGQDPLRGKLVTVDLTTLSVPYYALSYAWGSHDLVQSVEVMVDDAIATLPITSNLHSALHRLRTTEGSINLWVDALSINQNSDVEALDERSRQVHAMDSIFSTAEEVQVDLGPAPTNYEILISLGDRVMEVPYEVLCPDDDITVIGDEMHQNPVISSILADLRESSLLLEVLQNMMHRGYWTRIWCIQEYVLGQKVRFMVGRYFIDAEAFIARYIRIWKVLLFAWDLNIFPDVSAEQMYKFCEMIFAIIFKQSLRNEYINQSSKGFPLGKLLISMTTMDASEPRDRLYALYGLVDWTLAEKIKIDYCEPVWNLSLALSKSFVQHQDTRLLLCVASCQDTELPSWCINLDSRQHTIHGDNEEIITMHANPIPEYSWHHACGTTQIEASLVDNSNSLKISGCILESIAEIPGLSPFKIIQRPSPFFADMEDEETVRLFSTQLQDWDNSMMAWASSFLPNHSAEQVADALCRTLVADLDFLNPIVLKRCGDDFTKAYRAWQQELRNYRLQTIEEKRFAGRYKLSLSVTWREQLCGTDKGRLASVPPRAQVGDEICIFAGVDVPFVIRRNFDKGPDHYKLLGGCYLHGMVDGEALEHDDWKLSSIFID